jgi:hypothetical protein
LIDETDSKSDKIKSLENRVGAKIENTSKFFNQQLYITRNKSGQLYGFIPKKRHKLTTVIFGDYCFSKHDKIFRGGTLVGTVFPLVAALATGGIVLGTGLGSTFEDTLSLAFILSFSCLFLSFISVGILIGIPTDENIDDNSVYRITDIE